jgi:signal transduction histidine kinase
MWCGSWKIFNADGTPLAHEDCAMAIALKEKRPVKGTEILIRCPNGKEHYILPYPSPLFNQAGELTGALNVLIDITERKNIYARLVKTEVDIRNFAKQQNNLLEDERSRIAREIHDEFGQQLAGIKMSLSTLVKTCQQNGKGNLNAVEMMQSMINEVDNTMHSLRKFATELRPGILDTLGLVASIEWLAEEFENKTGIRCQLHTNVQDHYFEKGLSTCFFRICQEAFTNILKHSRATEVSIQITQTSRLLKLTIADNGRGIVLEKLDNPFSMGILGMRERANLVGARLAINSEKDSGTIINLTCRLND